MSFDESAYSSTKRQYRAAPIEENDFVVLPDDIVKYILSAGWLEPVDVAHFLVTSRDNQRLAIAAAQDAKKHECYAHVSAGFHSTFAITETGSLHMCGRILDEDYARFTQVPDLPPVKTVAVGEQLIAVITQTGELYVDYKHVEYLPPVMAVAVGKAQMAVITEEKELYVWGKNDAYQLGLSDKYYTRFTQVPDVPPVTAVAIGFQLTAVITVDGELCVSGKLPNKNYTRFIRIPDLPPVKAVAIEKAQSQMMAVITCDGVLYLCGFNSYGQAGEKPFTIIAEFTLVTNLPPVVAVDFGQEYIAVITEAERLLYVAGHNYNGCLGLPKEQNMVTEFTRVPNVKYVLAVAAGTYHTAIITERRGLCTTGDNYYGQLGVGKDIAFVDDFSSRWDSLG